jgi:hypothetical protein
VIARLPSQTGRPKVSKAKAGGGGASMANLYPKRRPALLPSRSAQYTGHEMIRICQKRVITWR